MRERRTFRAWAAGPWMAMLIAGCTAASAPAPAPQEPAASPPESPPAAPAVDPATEPAEPAPRTPQEPQAIVTTVPEIPVGPCTADPTQCTVALHSPAAGRMVVFAAEGATIRFGFGEFRAVATEHNEREVVAFLDARPADESEVRLDGDPGPPTNRWPFVGAALLDEGKALVHDDQGNQDVTSIVRETWDWVGCSGGCRQAGRQYRLRVPGDVFFRVTDLFEDSF